MTRAVIFGAELTTSNDHEEKSLREIENTVRQRISFYTTTAAAEGAFTGYAGLLLAMTDLPLWMSLKIKMLYDIADLYRYDIRDYKERVYLLHIFQLTFSRQGQRNIIYSKMDNWEIEKNKLPEDINQFDWKKFQLNYRDYLDLAKMLQLIPGIGAIVGFYVNHRLTKKLGENAMNAYRLRRLQIKL